MLKITNLKQLSNLPITTTLQEQVKTILTEPFHDEAETQQVWGELQCELWFLTSISDLSAAVVDDGNCSLFLPHTKSGLLRTVLLNHLAKEVMNDQRRFQVRVNPYIFAGDAEGRPIAHPKKAFARIKAAAGITDNFRIHDLRHSFTSILINSGNATLYDVQHLLGHQSQQTSTRYAHLASTRLREVSANVSELVQRRPNDIRNMSLLLFVLV